MHRRNQVRFFFSFAQICLVVINWFVSVACIFNLLFDFEFFYFVVECIKFKSTIGKWKIFEILFWFSFAFEISFHQSAPTVSPARYGRQTARMLRRILRSIVKHICLISFNIVINYIHLRKFSWRTQSTPEKYIHINYLLSVGCCFCCFNL